MKNKSSRLAVNMLIAMVAGIAAGLVFMLVRERLGADSAAWQTINRWLFQDITASGAEKAVGIFYICGQLFVKSLQMVIVPMVFTSIVLAIGTIRDAAMLGRISVKTFFWFLMTSAIALVLAGVVGLACYGAGLFHVTLDGVAASSGSVDGNPLNVLLGIIPSNIAATFSVNNGVLALIFPKVWYIWIALAVIGGILVGRAGKKKGVELDGIYREVAWELKHEAEAEAAR